MHNTRSSHAQNLYSIISEGYELPTDDYKHHQWLKPLKLRKGSRSEHNFNQLLEQTFLDPSKGGRNKTQVDNLRRHWRALKRAVCVCQCMTQLQCLWITLVGLVIKCVTSGINRWRCLGWPESPLTNRLAQIKRHINPCNLAIGCKSRRKRVN